MSYVLFVHGGVDGLHVCVMYAWRCVQMQCTVRYVRCVQMQCAACYVCMEMCSDVDVLCVMCDVFRCNVLCVMCVVARQHKESEAMKFVELHQRLSRQVHIE